MSEQKEQKHEVKWTLKIVDWENGVPGGAQTPSSLELMSFNHGVAAWDPQQPPQMQEVSLAFYVGPLAGPLMQKCMSQKSFDKVVVEVTHSRNKETRFHMKYELFDVRVTNVNVGGSSHQGGAEEPMLPYCSMSLNAKEMKVHFAQPDGNSTVTLK